MDKYVVEELLGVGGMGAVVAARRSFDGVRVALKVMLAEEAKHDDSTRRFFREARAAGVIDSAHVAKLLDFGRLEDGTPFMVLELLHGEGLDVIIRASAPMPVPAAVDLILQSAEGIAEAHARGIVHRDIKPSNLFVTTAADGSRLLKVLDFGISKATWKSMHDTEAPALTETNATLGSPQYMSPEQLRSSKDVDARTDIWSLGLILYKMLTGRPAFEAPNVGAHFAMILSEPPRRLSDMRPDVPGALSDVVWTCLEKDCAERWQDMGQLAMALAPFGTDISRVRAERIVTTLDQAGVSSSSHPRLSHSFLPGEATVRDAPRSIRAESATPPPPSGTPPLPKPPMIPADMKPSASVGELTTSAWSPVTKRSRAPDKRVRIVMIACGVVGLALVAFGAGRLFQDDDTAPRAATVVDPVSTPSVVADDRKARWLAKVRAGTATDDERRKLEALCVLEGDEACVTKARPAATVATASPTSKPVPRLPTRAPRPRPPKPAVERPTPQPKITPKGPMVDTL